LPNEAPNELIRQRLDFLLQKDSNGLNLIDYSFIRRKNIVGEYVQGMILKIGSGELYQEFPSLRIVKLLIRDKTTEELLSEIDKLTNQSQEELKEKVLNWEKSD
jgi:hypothetical protein